MTTSKGIMCIAALALLAFVCHASTRSSASDGHATEHAATVNTNGDDTASIPDFDGDGTIGFGDFLIFAGVFGQSRGDEKYDARHDLNDDGEIGFSDFVIFAQNFGKDVPSPVVTIPDANLRAAIEAALGKASGAPITVAEMETLTGLEAQNKKIRDLTGLEFATSLTRLDLRSFWEPTESDRNQISNLVPLSGLTNLTYLDLFGNEITNVSALSGLTNLTHLDLGWNEDITDISALSGLTNLTRLTLLALKITDISALSGLTNLADLDLRQTKIKDISALSGLRRLQLLELDNIKITDISALSGLTNLTRLSLFHSADITDISVLSGLTNLIDLNLTGTNINDISVLAGLINLEWLGIELTNISDISVLSGLTNLKVLHLMKTNITDISVLSSLTNLKTLNLRDTNITDISALSGLSSLTWLDLSFNNISDISPLAGLTNLATLDLRGNPLSDSSINVYIAAIENSGAEVRFDSFRKGDYDIELVFLDPFTEGQKNVLQYVARRWMSVITEDLPEYEFTQGWSGQCGERSYAIPSGERIDDLRIYVTSFDDNPDAVGWATPSLLRETTYLPVLGCMAFDLERANLVVTGLHEIGHVLGFGPVWDDLGFRQNLSWDDPNADTHFNGPLAIAAFDDAGGRDYTGKKVPVEKMDGSHWRYSVLEGELMVPGGGGALSSITVQSLADLGYGVDVTQADPYTLPGAAAKASAKIAAAKPAIPGPVLDVTRAHPDGLDGAELYGQGGIAGGFPSIFGDDSPTGRLESAERVWGRGMNIDLADERQMWGTAPPASAEPKLTCGAGIMYEPIFVVDPQGRVVRTIGR